MKSAFCTKWALFSMLLIFIGQFICDRLWENLAYGIHALFAQCAFLVAWVEICRSPDFVIYMSNNPSSNCCRCLRRPVDLYKGEISLHFDSPSRPSCRTRSPLLWALITILYLDTARSVCSLTFLASWASKNNRLSLSTTKFNSCSIFTFISNGSAQVHLIDFRVTRSMCHA